MHKGILLKRRAPEESFVEKEPELRTLRKEIINSTLMYKRQKSMKMILVYIQLLGNMRRRLLSAPPSILRFKGGQGAASKSRLTRGTSCR